MACAIAGQLLAANALAQERPLCTIYNDLVAAAPEHFESLRGVERQPGLFDSSMRLAPYAGCAVYTNVEAGFLCQGWPGSESLNRLLFEAERTRLRSCFADWLEAPYVDAPGPYVLIDGLRFVRNTSEGEITVGVLLGREVDGDDPLYIMGFALLFFPPDLAV